MVEPAKHSRLVTFGGVCLVIAALYLARDVLIPFALAALITFLLAPLSAFLERFVRRATAVVLVVTLGCGVLGGVTYLVAGQVAEVAEMLPNYRDNISAKVSSMRGGVLKRATDAFKNIEEEIQEQEAEEERRARANEEAPPGGADRPTDPSAPPGAPPVDPPVEEEPVEPVPVQVVEPEPTSLELIGGAFAPLLGPLGTAGMVVVLVAFMLLAREDLRDRLIRLMGRSRVHVTTQAIDDAGTRVSRYLLMQTLINCIHGVAVAIGMTLLDVPSALLWGLTSAVLRFIPYVGPWIAAALPVMVSVAVFEGWQQTLFVVGFFVLLELVSNNVLEPWLYGSSAGLSPLAVIVTAIFWTWLWGPIGLLLATPLTVCIVVIGKHIPQLQFINVLLSDEEVLEPSARFYQRLLAMDEREARKIAAEALERDGSLLDLYDGVILPALALVEQDRHLGHLHEGQVSWMEVNLRSLLDEFEEEAAREAAEQATETAAGRDEAKANGASTTEPQQVPALPPGLTVVVLPVHGFADDLAAEMLAYLVRAAGAPCEVVSVEALTSEKVDLVLEYEADVVCLSTFSGVSSYARHVCRRLHNRCPAVRLVAGLWGASVPPAKEMDRLGCGDRAHPATTLRQTLEELARHAPLAVLGGGRTQPRQA